jgi:hypothetical protein
VRLGEFAGAPQESGRQFDDARLTLDGLDDDRGDRVVEGRLQRVDGAPSTTRIVVRPRGLPCSRASLIAISLASVPEFARNTRPSGPVPASRFRRAARSSWAGLAK